MALGSIEMAGYQPVIQFSLFSEDRIGSLLDIINLLGAHEVHVMALVTQENIESTVSRIIVDDPDKARELFILNGYLFTENEMLVVEISTEADLKPVLAALLEAEVKIHTVYSFIFRPRNHSAVAFNVEEREIAADSLQKRGFKVLQQSEISR